MSADSLQHLVNTDTSPSYSDQFPLPDTSELRLWQATHYRQHPNIGFSPPFKGPIFIDPEQPPCKQNTAADPK